MTRPRSPREDPMPLVGSELSDDYFDAICDLLRKERGFDLTQYKDPCARRRIAKRMRTARIHDPAAYLGRIRTDRGELDALLDALTIHVSQFFRNPSTFRLLRESILPALLESSRRSARPEFRVWSVGCAGGEEPYSIVLLLEEMGVKGISISVLGTDINATILSSARQAVYPKARLKDVPDRILEKYFQPAGKDFRLCDRIRRRVEFRRHDILSGVDYPAADLILCRNVLIYFSREEQERILCRFSESISPEGILVLGRAETLLGKSRARFHAESAAEHIYRPKSN